MSHTFFTQLQPKIQQTHQLLFGNRQAKHFHQWQNYLKPQPIAGYIGFLGHQNLGDEILYQVYKRLFNEYQFLTYDGAIHSVDNPPFNYYPLELALYRLLIKPKHFYDLIFLGGGTLINRRSYLNRFQSALQSGQPCIVFGTGVCDPEFWQERDPDESYVDLIKEWVEALRQAKIVTVRGPRSAQILEQYGLTRPEFVSDPALVACSPRSIPFQRTGTIGINVGSHGTLWGTQQGVYKTLSRLIPELIQAGWKIELLPFHPGDLQGCYQLAQPFSKYVTVKTVFTSIDWALQQIQQYDLLIGQRLHSIVLACGCGVPFIALSYAPKCDDFIDSIHCQDFSLKTSELDVEKILSLMTQIDQNYDQHCQRLVAVSNHYRTMQRQSVQTIRKQLR